LTYQIELTLQARRMLENISDRRVRQKIQERIDGLAQEPEKQGKPLAEELAGYRSLRAVGQRYRIIYSIKQQRVVVIVMAVGLRRQGSRSDIYQLAKKLVRLGLVEPPRKKK
jgi:mRNA interferase RelE/StbE